MVLTRDLSPTRPSPGCFNASNHFPLKAPQKQEAWIFKDLEQGKQRSSTPLISHAIRGTEHVGLLRNTEGDAQTPPALYPHTTGLAWTLHQPTPLSWPVCPNHCTPSSSSQGEPAGFSFHFHPHPSWPEDNPHPRTGSKTGSAGCQGVLLDQRKG